MGGGSPPPTQAAGGIVIRPVGDGVEVLVIHRPRYDDWSLPKGHVDPGESPPEAALREVLEETGLECVIAVEAGAAGYATEDGEHKLVRYWVMQPTGGEFTPNDEVDEVRWLEPAEAVALLSYDLDRGLIRATLGTS